MAAKQSKSKKQESFGKGKVTPQQIAFIVDRYLCDNNFSSTRSTFRNEASSLISHSPIHHAPKTLLTLGQMLDEYICLKEQKVMLDQERVLIEQEKTRVQMLLQGMHNVMSAYNASGNLPPAPAAKSAVAVVAPPKVSTTSHPGVTSTTSMPSKLNTNSLPQSNNSNTDAGNFMTPIMNISGRKRKDTNAVDTPSAAKRTCGRSSSRKIPVKGQSILQQSDNANSNQVVAQPSSAIQSSPENCTPSCSQVQGSGVVKCLFNQSSISVPTNSSVPKTPTRANSAHSDKHISPSEISSVVTRNRDTTPNRCTVISTKRVMVSPSKQMAYIQMSHCISPVKTGSDKMSKRDHVRSRLDFDASGMPESSDKPLPNEISTSIPLSEKELNILDIDFPNLDSLGMDYFTEILNDFDFTCDGIDFSCHTTSGPSKDHASGSSPECNVNDAAPESSTVPAVLCEKDMKCKAPII
ncbi:hypothetical protein TanjilG_10370 [Lupinus angustifolius]|uniref:LisH domain-containing protein n=1 Tax=Lupinus angustifolius TaxID=3871 RepID=A0A4P1R435_LUPAN|nr:PREDICTED: uncharacterized protein LOC109360751 [Lupinus angustifolius]XP_019461380.1 PREDICTED: uncharacterized protein LOC109360751 [Lupinus angustifolius]XP_019461381.1 PREDICTED: uncharacterized protein LOC109360751 [Lupinus angustifolius]OIW01209.1 hypothetical protein TanjilG_10370 [Lupinus angustifolius]